MVKKTPNVKGEIPKLLVFQRPAWFPYIYIFVYEQGIPVTTVLPGLRMPTWNILVERGALAGQTAVLSMDTASLGWDSGGV